MKLQQRYPYDKTLLGFNNVYITLPDNSFFIKSHCIQTLEHIIWTGKTYILMWSLPNSGFDIETVKLIDVCCDNMRINLVVEGVISCERFIISIHLCEMHECKWKLLETDRYSAEELLEIEEFCGCKRTVMASNTQM